MGKERKLHRAVVASAERDLGKIERGSGAGGGGWIVINSGKRVHEAPSSHNLKPRLAGQARRRLGPHFRKAPGLIT